MNIYSSKSKAKGSFCPGGFSLAEVLVVIGIVAAITLPVLIGKIEDKKFRGARLRTEVLIGEVFRQINITEGFSSFSDSAKFTNALSKYMKIQKICTYAKFYDCFSSPVLAPDGEKSIVVPQNGAYFYTWTNTGSASAVLLNGVTVVLTINPVCKDLNKSTDNYGYDQVCANAMFDVNGLAKPNQVGKDIGFVSAIGITPSMTSTVGVVIDKETIPINWVGALKFCKDKGLHLPSKNELNAISFNKIMLNLDPFNHYVWTSSTYEGDVNSAWMQYIPYASQRVAPKSNSQYAICVDN